VDCIFIFIFILFVSDWSQSRNPWFLFQLYYLCWGELQINCFVFVGVQYCWRLHHAQSDQLLTMLPLHLTRRSLLQPQVLIFLSSFCFFSGGDLFFAVDLDTTQPSTTSIRRLLLRLSTPSVGTLSSNHQWPVSRGKVTDYQKPKLTFLLFCLQWRSKKRKTIFFALA
jgi:hypothetical protein